jgi:hypothetical protein
VASSNGSNGDDPAQRPAQYDLVELSQSVEGREAGSRGTIVAEGVQKGLVDFAWIEGKRDVELQEPDLQPVPYGAMKLVESHPDLRDED